ncbi:Oidioi.mRNA.OKI2018_I69.XSR.g13867.t1.cds [Oikopleura dioica]|uniref:Oidioi.mRNA.OKI2018_I69.XSR.g13867.t1.cds n=1 Tax=Oikopleura dioica TaxID=34765 RepID=A0ABN7SBX7_OIKDI|nr:Oidioi.mRNA.OKI2018_I69.XSR.g13867.t1.cds [Oikopleura dioica]
MSLVKSLTKCVNYTVSTQDGEILLMDNKADANYASYVFVRSQNVTQFYKMEVLERPAKYFLNRHFDVLHSGGSSRLEPSYLSVEKIPRSLLTRINTDYISPGNYFAFKVDRALETREKNLLLTEAVYLFGTIMGFTVILTITGKCVCSTWYNERYSLPSRSKSVLYDFEDPDSYFEKSEVATRPISTYAEALTPKETNLHHI